MPTDTRHKDLDWKLHPAADGTLIWDQAIVAVLMDVRDELKKLNALLYCPNFRTIPYKLDCIRRNTSRRRKRTPRK